ncbi:HD-GYP domain-containing protein [Streptomyces sp. ODS28]|uniref:HD-GYP domain-containing protein n=1 Tax=Streptomyces sp. ODS28 TaxID=3136688 RepID=UPI0031E6B33E
MRARRAGLPGRARAAIAGALCAWAWCAAPAVLDFRHTEWSVLLPVAGLYALCEYIPRCPLMGHRVPSNVGAFFPMLLTGVFLLPPEAAALLPLPGALLGTVERRHAGARRLWHTAQLGLAACAAARAQTLLSGGAADLSGPRAPGALRDFPGALLAAAVAALVFCAVVTALDGAILVTAERRPVRTAWRGQMLRAAVPHLVHGTAGLMMAVLWRSPYGPVAALFVLLPMCICCWIFAQYHRERVAHQATIRALVQAVDIKDRYTRGHGERVGRASAMIARELRMGEDRTELLRLAGILHDVGKLGVPTRVLRKDGPLTPEERRVIELHPEYGHEMVRGIGFLDEARSAILHHHERLDGSGYPYGLSGGDIPEVARVVAVADAFDAMTSTRSYRRGRPVPAAVEELRRCAGTQFDPRMVHALADALDAYGWSPAVTADPEPLPPPREPASQHAEEYAQAPETTGRKA